MPFSIKFYFGLHERGRLSLSLSLSLSRRVACTRGRTARGKVLNVWPLYLQEQLLNVDLELPDLVGKLGLVVGGHCSGNH